VIPGKISRLVLPAVSVKNEKVPFGVAAVSSTESYTGCTIGSRTACPNWNGLWSLLGIELSPATDYPSSRGCLYQSANGW
jgi:hypothetical protein